MPLSHHRAKRATIAPGANSMEPPDRGERPRMRARADQSRLYFDLILEALPDVLHRILETDMQGYEYQSDFARRYLAEGLEKGLEKGLMKGREEGREEGRTEGRIAALELARAKLEQLSPQDEAAIAAIHEGATLTALILGLGRATTSAQARAALDQAIRLQR